MSTGVATFINKPPEEPDGFNLKEATEILWNEAEKKYKKKRKRAEQLRKIRACGSIEIALQNQLEAYEQKVNYKKQTRAGRAETNITRTFAQFSDFLESYSGIAEIIKGVNSVGGIPYGALSILLNVARNKKEREEYIGGYLKDMASWLEDIRDYRNIYQSPKLHGSVFAIYKGVFEFVLIVWEYYTHNALARLWENIAKPPKLTIKVAAEDVKRSVNRLLANCKKELHKNAQDSGMMLRRIRRERQDEELREWKILTMRYRTTLGLQNDPWTATRYKKSLVESQNRYSDEPDEESMQIGNKQALEINEHVKRWLSCLNSSVLIVTAINHANSPLGSDLWLSAALADFAEEKLTDDTSQVIFHPIQANEHNPLQIVFGILCGVLNLSQTLFREHRQAVDDWIAEFKSLDKSLQRLSFSLFKLVETLLKNWSARHPEKTLYIFVDRIDFCLDMAKSEEKESLRKVLQFLCGFGAIGRLKDTGTLKVFILAAHNIRWPLWQFNDWNITDVPDGIVQKLGWRQGELEVGVESTSLKVN